MMSIMETRSGLNKKDILFLCGAVFFFFGCIASSQRTARTEKPGQVSFSGSYIRASNLVNSNSTPIELVAADARLGTGRGIDIGVMHTWDITQNNKGQYATYWGDIKFQLTNLDQNIGAPIVSLGLMKGYVYNEDIKDHITTLPIMISIPLNDYITPTLMYRHELIGKDFIPQNMDNPRSTFVFGLEVNLIKPAPSQWTPKLGLAIGHFNSLTGGEGDDGLIFNVGLSLDSPWNPK